jgi:tetratricopeptide (TPR) repeat protein/CO dehydrogenase nickel-insertion accessory protein CooC1
MIYTFYSYKGGVGRSMALANIAELFYAQGLRVLMIDWDLEAPGLERYFPVQLQAALKQPGIADMISDYKQRIAAPSRRDAVDDNHLELPDLRSYMLDVYPEERPAFAGRLWLMPAGRRAEGELGEYSKFVRTFDWEDFYQNWEGESFFEWFRQRISEFADAVVIDSRTGVTEMGGICTYQLADAVVMCCGSNAQSLDGTFTMAKAFKDPDLVVLRRGRPLAVLIVPARVEDRAEARDLSVYQNDFLSRFGRDQFSGQRALAATAEDMWDLKIPHVPYYAFRETVMVREASDVRHPDMYRALTRLVGSLAQLAPANSRLRERAGAASSRGNLLEIGLPAIFNAPRANPHFVGRDEMLDELESALSGRDQSAPVVVVTGLGGVGTTSLVTEYAHRHRREYDVVWWIRADDEATLNADYAGLAEALGLPERDERDQRTALTAVRAWLERNPRWLLVFDNATDPRMVMGGLPRTGAGHVLVTSRNPGWGADAEVLTVDVLSQEDSVAFLLRRTGDNDTKAAQLLAETLGDLPLALEQAAAYVAQSGLTLEHYLMLFRERAVDLLHRGSANDGADTVGTIWQMSFDRVREESPAGAALLRLCAFLAPDDIPQDLLSRGVGLPDGELGNTVTDPLVFLDAVAALRRYSLVRVSGDALSVHRLVQAIVLERLSDEAAEQWAGTAVLFLRSVFPDKSEDVSTWPRCARLLPHALAATDHAERLGVRPDETSWVLDRAAIYLKGRAEFAAARRCLERAALIMTASGESRNPALSVYLMHLGSVLRELGDLATAESSYRKALEIAESACGPEDPQVARILNRLGRLMRILGRHDEARITLDRALTIAEAAYGPDHPEVAAALGQLGRVQAELGDLVAAEAAFRRALDISEAAYGPGHPELAAPLSDLGRVISQLGRREEARLVFDRALAIAEAVYGPKHPSVSAILDDLGKVLRQLGKPGESRTKHEMALAIDEEAYGPDHLNVANDHQNLGNALRDLGDLSGARTHLQRALEITESALGPDHPGAAEIRNDLGRVLRDLGYLQEAREQFERALALIQAAYGPDHPDIAAALTSLGGVLSQLGDLDAARTTLDRALSVSECAYGPSHPEVCAALINLGRVLEKLREFQAAKAAYERALGIAEQTYGPDHPDVADCLDSLGLVLNELGDSLSAQEHLERAAAILEAAYGPRHPVLAVTLVHLAGVIGQHGQLSAAEYQLRRALAILADSYGPQHPAVSRTRQLLERMRSGDDTTGTTQAPASPVRLAVETVAGEDYDTDELAMLTRQLRQELLDLDVEAVEPLRIEDAPGGTKGIEQYSPGSLIVTVARSALTALAAALRLWLQRGKSRSIRIEINGDVIELSSVSSSDQAQLIARWLERHSGTPD